MVFLCFPTVRIPWKISTAFSRWPHFTQASIMQPYVTALAWSRCFSMSPQTWRTFWMSPAWPYVLTKIPRVTGDAATLNSFMRFTVASRRLRSLRRQQVSSSALKRTSSTSFGCRSMNFSTREMARYTRGGLSLARPSPTVFMSMRETVYLSVPTPCRCISSRADQASSTPLRRISSSNALAGPRVRSPPAPSRGPRPPRAGVATLPRAVAPRPPASRFPASLLVAPHSMAVSPDAMARDGFGR
mmetsp:Transcript_9907/g.27964  ORF Transcript_9907/g.27964 Transcript_9907/m.27964 type:complete len:244 (-) Transcript_9907:33-764(-)